MKGLIMEVCAVNRVDYDGETYLKGDKFACRKAVGQRLLKLGVVDLPKVELPADEAAADELGGADTTAEQLEQIAGAMTLEDLGNLFTEQPECEEVVTAFEARWDELEQQ
jgi:hypothetical protein